MPEATFKTIIGGELVELPATIAGIRETLPEERRAEFDNEVEHTPGSDLLRVLTHWALESTDAPAEDAAVFQRLEAGDFTGCVPAPDPADVLAEYAALLAGEIDEDASVPAARD